MVESFDYKRILKWINDAWAKSLVAVILFFVGLAVGQVQTESRVVGDCKYAGAFRVNHEAFVCQRRL
jgi:hypothetical protein